MQMGGARKPRLDKRRATGRIEHTLLDEGRASSPTDLRPSPATPPYHTKLRMFLSTTRGRNPDKEPVLGLRGAAVGATPPRLPPPRLSACGPSLTSSPDRFPARHGNGKAEPPWDPGPTPSFAAAKDETPS